MILDHAWFLFVLASLATFRLSRLITDDKITDWFRDWVIKSAPKPVKPKAREGITCPFCVSFYFSGLITFFLFKTDYISNLWPLWWPATWGGSVIINQVFVFLNAK